MKVHAISTGTVAVHERQREGSGPGPLRPVNTLLDRHWTDPLPIYVWVIEHPEGLIVVDTGETARIAEPGSPGGTPTSGSASVNGSRRARRRDRRCAGSAWIRLTSAGS